MYPISCPGRALGNIQEYTVSLNSTATLLLYYPIVLQQLLQYIIANSKFVAVQYQR